MLSSFIRILNNTIPNFQEEINKIYYECFNASNVETEINNGRVFYIMSSKDFLNYVKNTYAIN